MRRSLYLQDDDFRLSFLYGNFTTLTRFTEADFERVITEKLSPLYVSIHATDPEVRTRLLRNRRGATSLRWLELLLAAGVEVHGQVVVCPGVNDGAVLDDTMLGVARPLPEARDGRRRAARRERAQPRARDAPAHRGRGARASSTRRRRGRRGSAAALGRRLVFASDEYYLLAGRPFPALDDYDDVPAARERHRHGAHVRGARSRPRSRAPRCEPTGTRSGFFAAVDGAPAEGYRAPRTVAVDRRADAVADVARARPIAIVTGELGARVLAPLVPALRERAGVAGAARARRQRASSAATSA